MSRQGSDVDLGAITRDTSDEVVGVAHGAELVAYADAAVARSADLAAARKAVQDTLGDVEVVDAAAVIANFQRMVRIADGTGIPIDAPLDVLSADLRQEIGINEFPSAQGRGKNSALRRLAAPLMRRFASRVLRSQSP